ncbi:hypothetical protein CB0940_00609 [Cercospora beticola]|uniref:Pheromone alpha factor receptor n=1 Tax=Cercospora beticola TaxID=122368 RepID=A0A2G5IAE0_CERBT|nr:hypothetical protein CB0940_00609 [Cercospora beticola]PIB01741.1 hypothetical protein CB0940_00609 [Cercospora beticola]
MELAGLSPNATFDPYRQVFTIMMPDGTTDIAVHMEHIFRLQDTTVDTGIIYGVQLGISAILMLILAIMTRPEKRRSIIFFLNLGCLVLLLIRAIMMSIALHGPFYNFYNWVVSYYHDIDGWIRLSVAAEVVNFLVVLGLELSLLFQVRIVCVTLKTRWRLVVTAVTTFVAVAVCAVRFATMVVNARLGIVKVAGKTDAEWALIDAMASASNICIIASIIFFSAVFIAKLGHAIWQRRSMGMKQFGPMQIIFVMGCQTMCIPGECRQLTASVTDTDLHTAIFGILTYFVYGASQIYTLMPVVVGTFLPLSSMWAATNTNNINIAAPHQVKRNRDIALGPRTPGHTADNERSQSEKALVCDDTLIGDDSPKKVIHQDGTSVDVELGNGPGYIHVDRTYSVRSD